MSVIQSASPSSPQLSPQSSPQSSPQLTPARLLMPGQYICNVCSRSGHMSLFHSRFKCTECFLKKRADYNKRSYLIHKSEFIYEDGKRKRIAESQRNRGSRLDKVVKVLVPVPVPVPAAFQNVPAAAVEPVPVVPTVVNPEPVLPTPEVPTAVPAVEPPPLLLDKPSVKAKRPRKQKAVKPDVESIEPMQVPKSAKPEPV